MAYRKINANIFAIILVVNKIRCIFDLSKRKYMKKVIVSKLTSARAMMQLSYNAGGVTLEQHKLYTGGNRSGNTVGRLLLKKLSAPHDIILN